MRYRYWNGFQCKEKRQVRCRQSSRSALPRRRNYLPRINPNESICLSRNCPLSPPPDPRRRLTHHPLNIIPISKCRMLHHTPQRVPIPLSPRSRREITSPHHPLGTKRILSHIDQRRHMIELQLRQQPRRTLTNLTKSWHFDARVVPFRVLQRALVAFPRRFGKGNTRQVFDDDMRIRTSVQNPRKSIRRKPCIGSP